MNLSIQLVLVTIYSPGPVWGQFICDSDISAISND